MEGAHWCPYVLSASVFLVFNLAFSHPPLCRSQMTSPLGVGQGVVKVTVSDLEEGGVEKSDSPCNWLKMVYYAEN